MRSRGQAVLVQVAATRSCWSLLVTLSVPCLLHSYNFSLHLTSFPIESVGCLPATEPQRGHFFWRSERCMLLFLFRLRRGLGESISYPILPLPQVEQEEGRDQCHCSRYYQPQRKDPVAFIPICHLVSLAFSVVCFCVLFRPHRITLEAVMKQENWGGCFLFQPNQKMGERSPQNPGGFQRPLRGSDGQKQGFGPDL